MKISATIRKDYIGKSGESAVYVQSFVAGRRIRLLSSIRVDPENWDEEKHRVKRRDPNHRELNHVLHLEIARLNDILLKYLIIKREPTIEEIKYDFYNPVNTENVAKWMLEKIMKRENAGEIADGTAKVHRTLVKSYLLKYNHNLTFADITESQINDFVNWMNRRNPNKNTSSKYLRALKSYINLAVKDEMLKVNPFEHVKIQAGQNRIVYLTREEVRMLEDHWRTKSLTDLQWTAVRNWLFSFYACGMRRSDFKRLTFDNVFTEQIVFDDYKNRRFNKVHKIPVSKKARALIKEAAGFRVTGEIFTRYTDQRENNAVKAVAMLCGIKKNVSYHTARHTFATLFLEETNDLATLQQLLGHSKISQTMIYVHVSEKKKQEQGNYFYDRI